MTIVAQLQLHYTTKIHEKAAVVVAEFCGKPLIEDAKNIMEYKNICMASSAFLSFNQS